MQLDQQPNVSASNSVQSYKNPMKSKMQSEQIVPTQNYADCKRTQCFNSLPIYGF